jgi:hypothetical protein
MKMRAAVAVAVGLVLVLAACGGDDESGGGDLREQYVDAIALAEEDQDTPFSGDDVRCYAEAVVDGIGVDALEAGTTPAEIEQAGAFDPVTAGIELTEEDAEAVVDGVSTCVDLREVFLDQLGAEGSATPEQIACVDEEVDDELLESFYVASLMSGDDGEAQATASVELQAAAMPCLGG